MKNLFHYFNRKKRYAVLMLVVHISILNVNSFCQDFAYGKHNAIYLAIYQNYDLKVEDYSTQNRSLDLTLLMNISYSTIHYSNADGQRSFVLENASSLKTENDKGRTIYSIYYDDNKKLSFYPHKDNQVWFTTVNFWPNTSQLGNYFKLIFSQKLVY